MQKQIAPNSKHLLLKIFLFFFLLKCPCMIKSGQVIFRLDASSTPTSRSVRSDTAPHVFLCSRVQKFLLSLLAIQLLPSLRGPCPFVLSTWPDHLSVLLFMFFQQCFTTQRQHCNINKYLSVYIHTKIRSCRFKIFYGLAWDYHIWKSCI